MLVDSMEAAGLNSGLMMPQYTAASLVLENQTLATPDSIHSLPTSGEQEDHNANATTASRHALEIIKNVCYVIAIELFTASRAIVIRKRENPNKELGKYTQLVMDYLLEIAPYQPVDSYWNASIQRIYRSLELNEIPSV